jgi:hypothetical protein
MNELNWKAYYDDYGEYGEYATYDDPGSPDTMLVAPAPFDGNHVVVDYLPPEKAKAIAAALNEAVASLTGQLAEMTRKRDECADEMLRRGELLAWKEAEIWRSHSAILALTRREAVLREALEQVVAAALHHERMAYEPCGSLENARDIATDALLADTAIDEPYPGPGAWPAEFNPDGIVAIPSCSCDLERGR